MGDGESELTLEQLAGGPIDTDKAFGVEFGRFKNLNTFCPWCEDVLSSKTESCSVHREGYFQCKSCSRSGSAATFFAKRAGLRVADAIDSLKIDTPRINQTYTSAIPPVDDSLVHRMSMFLLRDKVRLSYLMKRRGLTLPTLRRFEIGADEYRLTIPVRKDDGVLVGIRRYLPNTKDAPKMVAHAGGSGSAFLYPHFAVQRIINSPQPYVILCEGEWDCMLLWQHGFDAITITAGVQTWSEDFTNVIASLKKNVVIVYDANDAGSDGVLPDLGWRTANERATYLRIAIPEQSVVCVKLPLVERGADITDWFVTHHKSADELKQLISNTVNGTIVHTPINDLPKGQATVEKRITLHAAAGSQYYHKSITLRCLVAGKANAPYIVPSKVKYTSTDKAGTYSSELEFANGDVRLLEMIGKTHAGLKTYLRTIGGFEAKDDCKITPLEPVNIEPLYVIPAIDYTDDQGPYCIREVFYVGHGLETNRVYDFEGVTCTDPRTQQATCLLTSAKPATVDIDSHTQSQTDYVELAEAFQTTNVSAKLEDIANDLAANVTRIFGRPDLHTAIDLVCHSAIAFLFEGTQVRKGWLETLIMGDTRTGKGFVTEGMLRHYGVGEIVSAENMSFAGLIGGIESVADRRMLKWGKIPLNDKRLVVLDECGALSHADISKLSRVRSEGIAEITKIISEKTNARTRLIWLANPRPSETGEMKMLRDYSYGIEAAQELIGAAEDMSRFDYVLTVAQSEVPSKEINVKREPATTPRYGSELCRKLIVWIWSRKPEQITFVDGVSDFILQAAQALGSVFTPKVCLIQSEDVRFKLARIAVAAAGRVFSTTDGVNIEVKYEHAEYAYNFLYHIYSKPSCGYAHMSAVDRDNSTLKDSKGTYAAIARTVIPSAIVDFCSGMLDHRRIGKQEVMDYGGLDIHQAGTLISDLVRLRALLKVNGGYYEKRPAFTTFLQSLRMSLVQQPNITTEEIEHV